MNRLKLATGIVLIFALGLLTGALGSGLYFKYRIEQFRDAGPETRRGMLMDRLTRRLDLTPDQQQQVAAIFDEMRDELSALREKHRPDLQRIKEEGHARIRAILNDDQKRQFDEMIEHLQQRRHGHPSPFGKHGRRGRPGPEGAPPPPQP